MLVAPGALMNEVLILPVAEQDLWCRRIDKLICVPAGIECKRTQSSLTSLLLAPTSPSNLPKLTSVVYINENSRIDVTVHSSGLRVAQLEESWVRNSDV